MICARTSLFSMNVSHTVLKEAWRCVSPLVPEAHFAKEYVTLVRDRVTSIVPEDNAVATPRQNKELRIESARQLEAIAAEMAAYLRTWWTGIVTPTKLSISRKGPLLGDGNFWIFFYAALWLQLASVAASAAFLGPCAGERPVPRGLLRGVPPPPPHPPAGPACTAS
jgi:hypothetical protein